MKIKLMPPLLLMMIIISCGQRDQEAKKSSAAILGSAQFSGITDSIKRFPDNPELYLRRALMLSHINQHATATPDYEKAWRMTGDEYVALDLASNLILSQKLPEAVKILEEGIKKFPDNNIRE